MRYIGWALPILAALEVISIILVSNLIGGGWTLFIILLSIFCGIFMLRNIGLSGLFLAMPNITYSIKSDWSGICINPIIPQPNADSAT